MLQQHTSLSIASFVKLRALRGKLLANLEAAAGMVGQKA
jgi:hypothetical protein